MTDESRLRQERSYGQEAERLLNSTLFNDAFKTIHENLHQKWEETKVEDREAREVIYHQMKCLNQVREYFDRALRKGKQADRKLQEIDNGTGSTG